MPTPLPTFSDPPLVEVVVGLQFDPLPALRAAHLGGFFSGGQGEWELLQDGPAIGQTQEPVGSDVLWIEPGLQFEPQPEPNLRIRALDRENDRMVQLENGWLVLNWRRATETSQYPTFKAIKPEFDRQRERFEKYAVSMQLGAVKPNLWELGYINMLPKGGLWNDLRDWPELFPGLLGGRLPKLSQPLQTVTGKWIFRLEGDVGRLQVILEHGRSLAPQELEIVVLKLIARGSVQSGSNAEVQRGFEVGHEAIVRTFSELLSEEARRKLGYKPG